MTTDVHASSATTLALAARLELAAAKRAAVRASSRGKPQGQRFPANERRTALNTRLSFREAVAILQMELLG